MKFTGNPSKKGGAASAAAVTHIHYAKLEPKKNYFKHTRLVNWHTFYNATSRTIYKSGKTEDTEYSGFLKDLSCSQQDTPPALGRSFARFNRTKSATARLKIPVLVRTLQERTILSLEWTTEEMTPIFQEFR